MSDEFDEKVVEDWIERIPSKRLQTITRVQMSRILEEADREASVGYSSKVRAWSIGVIRIVIRIIVESRRMTHCGFSNVPCELP
ncbi:hypothetical protein [Ferrimicrobium sp.]|uniref:hypothetical protein n=1 Tax=Ferrimicrobium sp. TaxID=2926050 RepID=UPI0026305E21|nr:hypothetical protein [Ferrimicrobium sp.]